MKPLVRISLMAVAAVAAIVPASASSSAPAVKLKSGSFLGMAEDRVGYESKAGPDGVRDGRFTAVVQVSKPIVLTTVVLQRAQGKGYAEQWDTNPGTSPPILGVYVNGKRINKTDRTLNVKLRARASVKLDLYANDLSVFAPGQRYRIVANFPNFVTTQTELTLPGKAATIQASFAGRGADQVGRGNSQSPNGEPDGKVTATLDTNGAWRILMDVAVRGMTSSGGLEGWGWDANLGTSFEALAIYVDGVRYRPKTGSQYPIYVPIDPKGGPARLELYGNDPNPGRFVSGQRFRVTAIFTDAVISPETAAVFTS